HQERRRSVLAARQRLCVAARRWIAEDSALAVLATGPARVDPKVAAVAHVDVHEAARRVDADAAEAELAREAGHIVVARPGDNEIDRAAPPVVRTAAVRSAVTRYHADFMSSEVGLDAVKQIEQARFHGVLVARGPVAQDVRTAIELRGRK